MQKLYLFLVLSLCSFMTFAADMTGIAQIDSPLHTGETIIQVVAKWGGIALLVTAGIMYGLGKAKGEAIGIGFYIIIGLGIIAAAFSWWNTQFTSGFIF
jgi:hypothetical protein